MIDINDVLYIEPWTHIKNIVQIDSPDVIYGPLGNFADGITHDGKFIFVSSYNGDGGLFHTHKNGTYTLGTTHCARCNISLPHNLYRLFATNMNIQDSRVVAMPYGLFDNRPYVSTEMADNMFTNFVDKDILCYARFSTWAAHIRHYIKQWCEQQSFILSEFSASPGEQTPETLDGYFRKLHRAKFMICPPGNGPDTYRVWEALYSNAIPIVIDCPLYRNFDLPILKVASFENVTEKLLLDTYEIFLNQTWDYSQLKLSYYNSLITNTTKELQNDSTAC